MVCIAICRLHPRPRWVGVFASVSIINEVDSETTEIPDDPTVTLDAYFSRGEPNDA